MDQEDIPSQLIQCGLNRLFHCLEDLTDKRARGGEGAKEQKERWITATHKIGKKEDLENYRGLSGTTDQ